LENHLEQFEDYHSTRPNTVPDRFTCSSMLKACTWSLASSYGSFLYAQALKNNMDSVLYNRTTLFIIYSSCQDETWAGERRVGQSRKDEYLTGPNLSIYERSRRVGFPHNCHWLFCSEDLLYISKPSSCWKPQSRPNCSDNRKFLSFQLTPYFDVCVH